MQPTRNNAVIASARMGLMDVTGFVTNIYDNGLGLDAKEAVSGEKIFAELSN